MNSKIKVLIGSDTADCGMAWAGALKGAGMYAITRRCDGNAVLSSIKSEAPDVAVLEAKMPFCDAVEVIRRLKMEKKYCPHGDNAVSQQRRDDKLHHEAALPNCCKALSDHKLPCGASYPPRYRDSMGPRRYRCTHQDILLHGTHHKGQAH